ncbi:MAG: ribokinase [Ignavibacteriaceae bacterium]|nr:ribokinase [Ignavibacteriaceae bacterium]
MKSKVVVVGSYNTDLTIKTERIPRPGETIIGGVFSEGGGGKGANQAVAAARAGANVSFIARVGNDALGNLGVQRLTDEGINTNFIYKDNDSATGVAFIVVDERGENSIVVASGANAKLSSADIDEAHDEISSADVLLVQLESPIDAIYSAIRKAHSKGAMVILNPAPAQSLSSKILNDIDVITPNKVEAEMITGIKASDEESLRAIAQKFFESGVKIVIITLGSKGMFVGSTEGMKLIPAYKVCPVDSTGAGDIFSGALAAFLAEGISMEIAVKMAAASASISVTRLGAQRSAPNRKEIEDFLMNYSSSQAEVIG